jgi:hypothetical protein
MHNTPRPSLDPMTIFRAQEVAKAEGQSLANALARLVQIGWDHRLEEMRKIAAPNMPSNKISRS